MTTEPIRKHLSVFTVPPGLDHNSWSLDVDWGNEPASGWAWCRTKPTWIEPVAFSTEKPLPDQSIHLLLYRSGPWYACVYPASSRGALCHIRKHWDGGLTLSACVRVVSSTADPIGAVVMTASKNPAALLELVDSAVTVGREWASNAALQPFTSPLPGPLDGVGFCTWSSLGEGKRPTLANVSALVDDLVAHDIPVQTFIIDDGWQNQRTWVRAPAGEDTPENEGRGLWDFGSHPELGEGGLAAMVKVVKGRLSKVSSVGVVEVGVWMTLLGGYWEGIHPKSPLVHKYKCGPHRCSRTWWPGVPNHPWSVDHFPGGSVDFWFPPPETAEFFWRDYFTELKAQGISFLKVDNQALASALDGPDNVAAGLSIWRALVSAANDVFGPGRIIHCMAQSETTFGGEQGLGIATGGKRFVCRASDDFGMVGNPDAHQLHLFANVLNATLLGQLCQIPDADMFMTAQLAPIPHALLRALFPGPLLLTDKPGHHDTHLLSRLIAKDKTGVARVVQTASPVRPLAHRLLDTTVRDHHDGTGLWGSVDTSHGTILAVWNVRGNDHKHHHVVDRLEARDALDAVCGERRGDNYALVRLNLEHGGVSAGAQVQLNEQEALAHVKLPYLGAAMFWLVPMRSELFGIVAVVGLVDKFAGLTAVESVMSSDSSVSVDLRYAGTLGVAIASLSATTSLSATVDGERVPVRRRVLPHLANGGELQLLEVEVRPRSHPDLRRQEFELAMEAVDLGDDEVYKVTISLTRRR
ncbi:hypothetical protein Q8F55_007619 [Vanrija albida]|uniref:Alpha-galactosidase n=1 Tax=Vanrija albida TaxID=181172 RepID=A0ABR3PUX7_9TREE